MKRTTPSANPVESETVVSERLPRSLPLLALPTQARISTTAAGRLGRSRKECSESIVSAPIRDANGTCLAQCDRRRPHRVTIVPRKSKGESQGAALDRVLPEFNQKGYRITLVVQDEWSFAKHVIVSLASACTLFIWGARPNFMIIEERVE